MRLIHTQDHILSAFDRSIAAYATQQFRRSGIDLVLGCRVGCPGACTSAHRVAGKSEAFGKRQIAPTLLTCHSLGCLRPDRQLQGG